MANIMLIFNYYRPVLSTVEPGYIKELIPGEPPVKGEHWTEIMKDIERVIMPGITHWHSPQFHAYYPTGNSYPSIVAEMLSAALGIVGFSWISSPACTELEVVTLDWLGKAIGLPAQFLNEGSNGVGGGVIQGSASECTLLALLSARERCLKKYAQSDINNNNRDEGSVRDRLVAYTSGTFFKNK